MCNLYSITTNQAAITALFRVVNRYVGNLAPMPGVFPDYKAPIVRNGAGGRELVTARWGMPSSQHALMEATKKRAAKLEAKGKSVDFKAIATATPRGRTIGQVLQQFWKRVGANMEIEQIDQATIVPRAFMRQFQLTPWRIVDLADPDPQMYANFHTGSPVALANYSNPELDRLLEHARTTADVAQRTEDYCAITRLINKEAIWFWTFQNTYYAIASAKLKGLPKIYGGVIDVSDAWME